ncbi:hypothetical protein RND81_02G120600 [Saponaria officinalis]|uniref:Uncharacterized protein n=1 Tax=Saponaria officinalis TaxID=3572 RepID=A0AAW1MMB6_SAPOF
MSLGLWSKYNVNGDDDVWDSDVLCLEPELIVGRIHMWVIRMVPILANCFSHFITSKLKRQAFSELDGTGTSSTLAGDGSLAMINGFYLLARRMVWAHSLSQGSNTSEWFLRICLSVPILSVPTFQLSKEKLRVAIKCFKKEVKEVAIFSFLSGYQVAYNEEGR